MSEIRDMSTSISYIAAAVKEEERDNFKEALKHYLMAIKVMRDDLCFKYQSMTDDGRSRLQYQLSTCLSRIDFIVSVHILEGIPEESRSIPWESNANGPNVSPTTLPLFATKPTSTGSNICVTTSTPSTLEKVPDQVEGHTCTQQHSEESSPGTKELSDEISKLVVVEKPNVSWSSVIGVESAKTPIQEAVLVPLLYPGSIQAKNSWRGILLFGPTGVGKTQLVKAVATEAESVTFINLRLDVILSKWLGETEKGLTAVFQLAKTSSPSIIFIDEIDAICSSRGAEESEGSRRLKNALLMEMDGLGSMAAGPGGQLPRVTVIGITNIPGVLDKAFLRRFQKRIYVPLPNRMERLLILEQALNEYEHVLTKENFETLAASTDKYSGSDLHTLVTEAGMKPLRDVIGANGVKGLIKNNQKHQIRGITMTDCKQALRATTPTNDDASVRNLEAWNEKFGDGNGHYYDFYEPQLPETAMGKVAYLAYSVYEFFAG